MGKISVFSAVVLILLPLQAVVATPGETSAAIPQLRVWMLPHNGIIPASMVDGRPVYKFQVAVGDERKQSMFVRAETLLQAGDTRSVERGNARVGFVRGAIAIDGQGRASYKAQYLKDGRVLLETSAELLLLPN